jgi:hypothetical protein
MNHPNASDWIGLVRGEHSWLVVARLRRHLKHCPHCAVELKEITNMLTVAKPKEAVASKSLADKTQDALPLSPSQGRKLRSLGLVGGGALVAGAALFFAMPGGVVRPSLSFASVEEALSQIKTVHWVETSYSQSSASTKKEGRSTVSEGWAELASERFVTWQRAGSASERGAYLLTKQDQWWYHPKTELGTASYLRFKATAWGRKPVVQQIREQILFSPKESEQANHNANSNLRITYSPWQQTETLLEQKRAVKFTRQGTYQTTHKQTYQTTTLVWVDPATKQLLRREESTRQAGSQVDTYRSVAENFRYNEMPPPGIFDLPLPAVGERYLFMDSKQALSINSEDRVQISALAQRAVRAYVQRDTVTFRLLWDVQSARKGSITAWEKAIILQEPAKTWSYEGVNATPARMVEHIRKSTVEPFPPALPEVVDIKIKGWMTAYKRPRPYSAYAEGKLIKCDGIWKIQQLSFPFPPYHTRNSQIIPEYHYKK